MTCELVTKATVRPVGGSKVGVVVGVKFVDPEIGMVTVIEEDMGEKDPPELKATTA